MNLFNKIVHLYASLRNFVLSKMTKTIDGGWVVSPYTRLYSFILCKLRKDIEFVGKSRLYMHPSTNLIMWNSKIVVQDGTLQLGARYLWLAGAYDLTKDNCRIHLYNSVMHTIGDVTFYPGCRIMALNGTLIVRNGSIINAPTYIFVRKKVEIGEHCILARNLTITDSDWHGLAIGDEKPKESIKEVVIKDHCWIGVNAVILKGVTIGEGAMVGANSVVTKDVEPRTMVAGNPARVIKRNVVWEM